MDDPRPGYIPLSLPEAPIFYPSEKEFADPYKYFLSIRKIGERHGICKVVPPSNWQPPFSIDPDVFTFKPRIQELHRLEAHTKAKADWWDSFYAFSRILGIVKSPIIQGKQLDLCKLSQLVDATGKLEPHESLSLDWCEITRQMGFVIDNDDSVVNSLREYYQTLLQPMHDFVRLIAIIRQNPALFKLNVSTRTEEEEEDEDKENNPPPPPAKKFKKQAEVAVATEENNSGEDGGQETNEPGSIEFELRRVLSFGLVTNGQCTKCRKYLGYKHISTTAAPEIPLTCSLCFSQYHFGCLGLNLPPSELVTPTCIPGYCPSPSQDNQEWCCRACIGLQMFNYAKPSLGFEECASQYDLYHFGDFADSFKKNYFKVENPSEVSCKVVENEFWSLVMSPHPKATVIYGADLHVTENGSGFPVSRVPIQNTKLKKSKRSSEGDVESSLRKYEESGWNLNNLPKMRDSLLRFVKGDISGMTVPWLYVGMCFTSFCWHNEDHWTPSINYLHFGEPKTWYGVPGAQADAFEQRMRVVAPTLFQDHPDILHQLVTMIHPNDLTTANIEVVRTDQRAGEFVLTFPKAFHAGFNQGFNCAEAVNFATSTWLQHGLESIEYYSDAKRVCVFSHEEMLVEMARYASSLTFQEAKKAHTQLKSLITTEKKFRRVLQTKCKLESKNRRRIFFDDFGNDDDRSCAVCRTTVFFSAVTCKCQGNLESLTVTAPNRKRRVKRGRPKKQQLQLQPVHPHPEGGMKIFCSKHCGQICECDVSQYLLLYRYTTKELDGFVAKLDKQLRILRNKAQEAKLAKICKKA